MGKSSTTIVGLLSEKTQLGFTLAQKGAGFSEVATKRQVEGYWTSVDTDMAYRDRHTRQSLQGDAV